ncbi:unnamed protein product, partial [Meganyctiphanes norvegica]
MAQLSHVSPIYVYRAIHRKGYNSNNDPDRFFIIGHQKNDIETAEEAIKDGANALEIDINFDKITGKPTIFKHGWPCDVDIISQVMGECSRSSPYKTLLGYLSQQTNLALIVLEGKVNSLSIQVQKIAGKNAVKAIEEELFDKGFKGTVVIGCLGEPDFITSAAEQASVSKYKSQIYFTLLRDYSGAVSVISYLHTLAVPNIVYSIGTITFDPRTYHDDIKLAALNKIHGAVSGVCTWTINREASFEAYYLSGVRGITTNNVKNLSSWASRRDLTLAQAGDDTLRPAWNLEVITSNKAASKALHSEL